MEIIYVCNIKTEKIIDIQSQFNYEDRVGTTPKIFSDNGTKLKRNHELKSPWAEFVIRAHATSKMKIETRGGVECYCQKLVYFLELLEPNPLVARKKQLRRFGTAKKDLQTQNECKLSLNLLVPKSFMFAIYHRILDLGTSIQFSLFYYFDGSAVVVRVLVFDSRHGLI